MYQVQWLGDSPWAPALLRERGFEAAAPGAATAPIATLVRTAAPPTDPPATPWLWLPPRAPGYDAVADAVRRGAYDVIALDAPDGFDRLAARLEELAHVEPAPPDAPHIVAEAPAARAMLAQIARAARTSMPVLITGETGTGKEEAARLIHAWSQREGPWLPINCAAIPNELMESELFGHVRGAFSGAVGSVDGKLRAAEGGTVFLDEIDDTPLSTQVKLLRVLEDGEVTRVGETRGHKVDFRIVAATNRDLLGLVAQGRFGDDLYQRLAIVHLVLPPLRARREDIGPLARHFVEAYYRRQPDATRAHVDTIAAEAIRALEAYDWPGNVRELRNVIFQALVYKRAGRELLLSDLRRLLAPSAPGAPGAPTTPGAARTDSVFSIDAVRDRVARGAMNLRAEIERLEAIALRAALEHAGGSPTRAARLLGEVGRGRSTDPGGTVRAMMKRLRIG
jgi:DNA-binding NtrC family response regulator